LGWKDSFERKLDIRGFGNASVQRVKYASGVMWVFTVGTSDIAYQSKTRRECKDHIAAKIRCSGNKKTLRHYGNNRITRDVGRRKVTIELR